MTTYWPSDTDWGTEPKFVVEQTRVGTFAIYDADADCNAAPLKVFNLEGDAERECARMNGN